MEQELQDALLRIENLESEVYELRDKLDKLRIYLDQLNS
jgi:uncharacterized protein YceH (UPF0502 family)